MNIHPTGIPKMGLSDWAHRLNGRLEKATILRFPDGKASFYAGKLQILDTITSAVPTSYVQDFYLFIALTNGTMVKVNQDRPIVAQKGSIYISIPGQIKRWELMENAEGYFLAFSKQFLSGIDYQRNMYSEFPMLLSKGLVTIKDPKLFDDFVSVLARINSKVNSKNWIGYELISLWTLELLFLLKANQGLLQTKAFPTAPEFPSIISLQFIQLMENYFVDGLQNKGIKRPMVGEFADALAIHPNYLNEHLISAFGKTAKVMLTERCMLAAKCKLLHSRLTVSEICYLLDYDNPSYFSRMFRKHVGISPGQYRTNFEKLIVRLRAVPVGLESGGLDRTISR